MDSREGNMGTRYYTHFGRHYMVEGNKVGEHYRGFDLSHYLDSSRSIVLGNAVGMSSGGNFAVDMMGETSKD